MFLQNTTRLTLGAIAALGCFSATHANAATLVEIDFAGSGGVGTLASSDAQFTLLDPGVTFDASASALSTIGGSSGTSSWTYDATNTAAVNPDLHVGSTFGAPTRYDLDLGTAASGFSYTITRVEIDVRASNSVGTNWDFMYRRASDNQNIILSGGAIATQSGADPITTYGIDLTTAISASDAATDWTLAQELRFAFWEPTAAGNDNLQIDGIRLIGTVVPEPSSLALLGLGGLAMMCRRR